MKPSPIPVGSPGRDRNPAAASPGGSGSARKPRRLQRLESKPKPLTSPFREPLGRGSRRSELRRRPWAVPSPEEPAKGRSPLKTPFRIMAPPEGPAALPEPVSKAEASSTHPVFRVAAGAWARPRLPPAPAAGRIPRPSPSGRPSGSRTSLSALPGSFVKSPPRFRLRLCGRGFVRRLRPSASSASVLGGATAPSAWVSRPFRSGAPFPVRRLFRPHREAVSFNRFAKAESACG